MNKQVNEWQLSRKTRTGAWVLMALILVLIIVWRLLPSIITPAQATDDKELQSAWTAFKAKHITPLPDDDHQQQHAYSKPYNDYQSESRQQAEAHPVPFDPNTASEAELITIGFQPRTAKTIIKYRSKGGTFRKKEDLQKLYTLSKEDYERIAPYVRLGESQVQERIPYPADKPAYEKPALHTLELNGADAEALLSLRGIGPAFSKRIINFRNALGGFVEVEQLKEVYGFPDSTYQQLKGKLVVDAGKVKKININQAGEEELGKHPYIGRKLAANIIKTRNEIGNYSQMEQLKQVPLINDEKYRKIAPYLSTH